MSVHGSNYWQQVMIIVTNEVCVMRKRELVNFRFRLTNLWRECQLKLMIIHHKLLFGFWSTIENLCNNFSDELTDESELSIWTIWFGIVFWSINRWILLEVTSTEQSEFAFAICMRAWTHVCLLIKISHSLSTSFTRPQSCLCVVIMRKLIEMMKFESVV